MSKSKEDYGSAYLKSCDLLHNNLFRTATVKISEIHPPGTIKTASGSLIDKFTLSFEKATKMLVIGPTNYELIQYATGESDRDRWIGKSVKLVVRIVEAFNEMVPAIRVWPENVKIPKGLHKRFGKDANEGRKPHPEPKKKEEPSA